MSDSQAAISFPMLGDFVINPSNYISIGGFKIYWYAIIIACGFLIGVFYICKRAAQFGLTQDNVLDAVIIGAPLGLIFARAYYVVFNLEYYLANPAKIIAIRDGGLAIYGMIIGAVLAMIIYTKYKKISLPALADLVCIGFLIGQGIGRWGNFINREAHGYETDIFCRMGLTYANGVTVYYHPTFLYESLWDLTGFVILHFFSKKRRYDGEVFLAYLTWYGLGRSMIEGLRTDSLYIGSTDIRVSQLLSIVLFITGAILLFYNRFKVKHDPQKLYVNVVSAQKANDVQNKTETEKNGALELNGEPEEAEDTGKPDKMEKSEETERKAETNKSEESEKPEETGKIKGTE